MVSKELLNILVCPKCKGELEEGKENLTCRKCLLSYPIKDDIPVMLIEEAENLQGK